MLEGLYFFNFFVSNSLIFWRSLGEEEDEANQQMQSVLLFKQTQQEVQGLKAFAFLW